jgi:hypothetical protein
MVAESSRLGSIGRGIGGLLAALLVASLLVFVPVGRYQPSSMTLLVPAYFYPAGESVADWGRLAASAPTGPLQVIVNPANGPGLRVDPNYAAVVRKLRDAGVKVLGYVHTSYGDRDLGEVEADVETFLSLYAVDGFFVDEMSSDPERVSYYTSLRAFIKDRSPGFAVVGNPGTTPDEAYASAPAADTLILFEGPARHFRNYRAPEWTSRYPRSRFGHIVYGTPTEDDMRTILSRSDRNHAGTIFIGDGQGNNPYSGLPPYWDLETAARKAVP